uniref:Uncharacterized protein n=1 Tax=Macrostomum lignano TaxID=282301 RepID=A0A1I8GNZ0_9PLAT
MGESAAETEIDKNFGSFPRLAQWVCANHLAGGSVWPRAASRTGPPAVSLSAKCGNRATVSSI